MWHALFIYFGAVRCLCSCSKQHIPLSCQVPFIQYISRHKKHDHCLRSNPGIFCFFIFFSKKIPMYLCLFKNHKKRQLFSLCLFRYFLASDLSLCDWLGLGLLTPSKSFCKTPASRSGKFHLIYMKLFLFNCYLVNHKGSYNHFSFLRFR